MMIEQCGSNRWLVTIYVVAAILIFGRIDLPLLQPEETRYADIAREMSAHSSWLIPVFEGQTYLDKPPLLYWLVAPCDGQFGPANWSARLITALAAWLTILVVGWWGQRIAGSQAGVLAAGVLTLCGDFVYRAPMLTMNGLLGFFVTAALATGHVSRRTGPRSLWPISALLCAAGVMVKGPIAMILVIPPLACASIVDSELKRPNLRDWAVYFGLAILPVLPWYIAVAIREPTFLEYFFWRHNVLRFVQPFDHAKPFWAYLPQIAIGLFPWTALMAWIIFKRHRLPGAAWFGLLTAAWGLLFFSISGSKRPAYVIPIEPAFALAVGLTLADGIANTTSTDTIFNVRRLRFVGLATAIVLTIGVFIWLPRYSAHFGRVTACRTFSPCIAVCLRLELSACGSRNPKLDLTEKSLMTEF